MGESGASNKLLLGELAHSTLSRVERAPCISCRSGRPSPHGPHVPLATDTLISVGSPSRGRTAARRGGRARPPGVLYGVTRYGSDFPGVISIQTPGLLVTDICSGLARVVLVNSHLEPERVWTLREPASAAPRRHAAGERRAPDGRVPSRRGHAGRYETSLVLADRPDLVDQARMATLEANMVNMLEAIRSGDELGRNGHGSGVRRCAGRGHGGRGRADVRDPCRDARRADS